MKNIVVLLLLLIAACSSGERTVKPSDYPEPTQEELKQAMRYHGITYAEQDSNGEWIFYRDGQRCRLFAYQEQSSKKQQKL